MAGSVGPPIYIWSSSEEYASYRQVSTLGCCAVGWLARERKTTREDDLDSIMGWVRNLGHVPRKRT
jgi:hypothetical protein